jgi:hypothetical protein
LSGLIYPAPNFGQSYVAPFRYMSHAAVSLIEEDVADKLSFDTTSTQGNFNTLRCLIDGTNYEVQGIGLERPTRESQLMRPLRDMLAEVGGAGDPSYAWVVWTTGPSTAPGRAALWMPEHEPTPVLPLHIGRSCGIHPFELVRDVYDQRALLRDTPV